MILKNTVIIVLLLQFSIGNSQEKNMIILENDKVRFEGTINGSAFTKFELKNKNISPLDWKLPDDRLPSTNIGGYSFQGHFLALGTWGMPTEGEQAAGIKFYGEVNTQRWVITQNIISRNGIQTIETACKSPVERLDITRKISLFDKAPLIKVEEQITNNLPIGRPYNILQHATFGGQFINQKTILNSNAGKGFYQNGQYKRTSYIDIEDTSYQWPNAVLPDGKVDLTRSGQVDKSFVSSHIFPKNTLQGWATLANVEEGFLIGYVWDINAYPWLNVWHQYEDGKVKGRAIEFATCGMWQSFEYLMSNDSRFFGKNSFEYIDAGEHINKFYYMFLLPINSKFKSVEHIEYTSNHIIIKINNGTQIIEKIIKF